MKKKAILLLVAILSSYLVLAYEISYQGTVDKLDSSSLGQTANLTIEINDSNVIIYNQTWENGVQLIKEGVYGFGVILGRDYYLDLIQNHNYTLCTYVNNQVQGSCSIFNSATGKIPNGILIDRNITGIKLVEKTIGMQEITDGTLTIKSINLTDFYINNTHLNITTTFDLKNHYITDSDTQSLYVDDNLTVKGYVNILSGELYFSNVLIINGTQYPAVDDLFDLGLNNTNRWRYGYFSRDLFFRNAFGTGFYGDFFYNGISLITNLSNLNTTLGQKTDRNELSPYLKNNTDINTINFSTNYLSVNTKIRTAKDSINELFGNTTIANKIDDNNYLNIESGNGSSHRRSGFQTQDNGTNTFLFYVVSTVLTSPQVTMKEANSDEGLEIEDGTFRIIPGNNAKFSQYGDINATRRITITDSTFTKAGANISYLDLNITNVYTQNVYDDGVLLSNYDDTDVRNSINLNRTDLLINISNLNTTLGKKADRGESATDGSKIANGTDASLKNLNVTLLNVTNNTVLLGNLSVDNGVLFVDVDGNKVGIGTAAPTLAQLQLFTSTAGAQLHIRNNIGSEALPTYSNGNDGLLIRWSEGGNPYLRTADIVAQATSTATAGGSQIRFWTQPRSTGNPTVVMLLDKNSYVGIGTSSPNYNLHVWGNASINNSLYVIENKVGIGTSTPISNLHSASSSTTSSAVITTTDSAGNSGSGVGLWSGWSGGTPNHPAIIWTAGEDLRFGGGITDFSAGSGFSQYMVIKNGGNVGIGTTTPLVKLHVQGNGSLLNITNASNTFLFVNSSGRVGIGTATPTHVLNVVGATNFTGNSIFGGSTITLDTSGSTTINQKGTQLSISQTNAAGNSLVDIAPISSDGSSQGLIRFFRLLSTTSANSAFQILPGDNTGNVVHDIRIKTGTTTVWNEQGYDMDFRWEGDNDPNLLYLDAGKGRVGINKTDPAQALDVKGSANISNNLYVSGGTNSISNITGRLFALSLNSPSGHAGIDIDIASGINKDGGAGGNVNIARGSDASGGSGAGGNAGTVTIAVGGDAAPSAVGGNGGAVNIGSGGQGDGDVGGNGATITMAAGNTGTAYGNDGTVNIGTSLGLKNAVLNVYGTINDLSPYWDSSYGSALDAVMNVKGSNGELNDTSLPINVRGKYFILNNGIEYKSNESLSDFEQIQDIISKEGITDIELANASVVYKRDIGAYIGMLTEAIKELKTENDLIKAELCKKDSGYTWCK